MSSRKLTLVAMLALTLGAMIPVATAKAGILDNWFGPRYTYYRPMFPGQTVVAGYSPTVAYSPVVSGCSTCATTTTTAYAPYTSYRPVSVAVPVTTYRPMVACNSCGGATTVLRPVTMYRQQVSYQPVTSYRPVVNSYGGCNTCGVQTAAYAAPACSTCGVASGGCASGNCGVNYGAVASSGCSTCGNSSGASSYTVQPGSNFVPTPANQSGSAVPQTTQETPAPAISPQSNVPRTQVEPQEVEPDSGAGPSIPMTYRESAAQQLKPIPQTNKSNSDSELRARPRLVNPQDKTARANQPNHRVLQAVYSSEAPVLKPVSAPALKQPSAQALKDAEGWGAKR